MILNKFHHILAQFSLKFFLSIEGHFKIETKYIFHLLSWKFQENHLDRLERSLMGRNISLNCWNLYPPVWERSPKFSLWASERLEIATNQFASYLFMNVLTHSIFLIPGEQNIFLDLPKLLKSEMNRISVRSNIKRGKFHFFIITSVYQYKFSKIHQKLISAIENLVSGYLL